MGLPKQVQDQAEAAERYDQSIAQAKEQATTEETTAQAQPPADTAQETRSQISVEALQEQIDRLTQQLNDENSPTWKQRFSSLQGMYNSQVPQLQQQVKQLMETVAAKQAEAKPSETRPTTELVTKTDVEAFGEDLIDMARRVARDELVRNTAAYEEKIAQLTQKLEEAKQQVGAVEQTQVQTQSEQFFTALNSRLPNWEQIQSTKECQEFLSSMIPGTQVEWNTTLVNAANKFNLKAVLEVFDQFFRLYPQYAPKQPRQSQPNRAELERQVAPSKSSASTPTPQGGKRLYSGSEYEAESMRVVRLAQQGKHDDATRLEAELNLALSEGRVR